mmetsp:Transcript_16549/g.39741  ORF Transcript_16549/g.39741 Transcript_16549/m.39741 type:complete len:147 (-) Transcript_16549:540-980(-)
MRKHERRMCDLPNTSQHMRGHRCIHGTCMACSTHQNVSPSARRLTCTQSLTISHHIHRIDGPTKVQPKAWMCVWMTNKQIPARSPRHPRQQDLSPLSTHAHRQTDRQTDSRTDRGTQTSRIDRDATHHTQPASSIQLSTTTANTPE